MELIGLITIAFGALAVLRSSSMALAVVCCAALLGAASAMSFGSANITPGHLSLVFFAGAVIIREKALAYGSLSFQPWRPGLILLALSIWALVSSFVLPRLFAGEFIVFPMNSQNRQIIETPLYPSGANFNQAVYFLAGPIIFAGVSSIARSNEMMKRVAMAIIACSILNLVIVLVDTITFAVGASGLLDFIRNANYAQNFMHQFMGVKRVTGAFPEASTFATMSVGLFAFNFQLWRRGTFSNVTGPVALLTLVALLFSFSSTGYVVLIMYLSFVYATSLVGAESNVRSNVRGVLNQRLFAMMAPALALVAAIVLALKPDLLNPIVETFDNSIASKLSSASGIERSSWNEAGLGAFFSSFGLGAGVGSVRTSSFIVAVLGNMGIIGAILFPLFLMGVLKSVKVGQSPLANSESYEILIAARAGAFCIFAAACVSAGSVDLGIFFYVFAGMACASLFYRTLRTHPQSFEPTPPNISAQHSEAY